MNEEEIEQLYEDFSIEYGVPMPPYIVYERRPEVRTPMPGLTLTITRKMGVHIQLSKEIVGDDPFGLILLSKGTKGILKDEAAHEFFHYYDYLTGRPVDEKLTRSRTRKYMRNSSVGWKRLPR